MPAARYAATGLALFVSLTAALIYAAAAILGFNFYNGGRLVITAAVGLPAALCLVATMVHAMILKARRHARAGRRRERAALLMALLMALAMSPFFCKYADIATHRAALKAAIAQATEATAHIDADYNAYAAQRINRAPKALRPLLERQLTPPEASTVWAERRAWLLSLKNDEVWNVFMPANIAALTHAAQTWTDEYTQVSAIILADEGPDVAPFTHQASNTQLATFTAASTHLNRPTPLALAALAIILMAMPLAYLTTRRPPTAIEGTH